MKKEKQGKNIFKIVKIVAKTIAVTLFVAFVVVVCLQRFSNNKISFFNYRMFTVISGSMKPKYDIGDVLISKKVKPSKIKVGDTVSYLGNQGSFRDKVVTHQVVEIELTEFGEYLFHTKGLANLIEDPVISEEQLYGVVKYKSIILSTIYKIVSSKVGFYLFIIIPIVFIIGSEILSILLKKEEARRQKLQ